MRGRNGQLYETSVRGYTSGSTIIVFVLLAMSRSIDYRRIEVLDPDVVAMLRNKTVAERVEMVFDAENTLRLMLDAHLKWRHPDWTDEQVREEIARRWLRESA